jgi:hypothetical protein
MSHETNVSQVSHGLAALRFRTACRSAWSRPSWGALLPPRCTPAGARRSPSVRVHQPSPILDIDFAAMRRHAVAVERMVLIAERGARGVAVPRDLEPNTGAYDGHAK